MSCAHPIADEQLVAYWANDLDAATSEHVEDHLFACDACRARAEGIARVAEVFRGGAPPVISRDELAALYARGAKIAENTFVAGVRKAVRFEPHLDFLIHHLGGLDLADAERVDVAVRAEGTDVTFEDMFVPFDRERGEILIACQRHFGAMPADVIFDVQVHRKHAPATITTFWVPHLAP